MRYFKLSLAIIALGLFTTNVFSQSVFGNYTLEHWDNQKGLPSNLVLHIYTDNDGYIWLSGYDGLIRFDGRRFKVFNSSTHPEFITNAAYMTCMDQKGYLWVPIVNQTILGYHNGVFQQYRCPWPIDRPEMVVENKGYLFQNDNKDFILFDFGKRAFKKLTKPEFITFLKQNSSKKGIVADSQGRVFFTSKRQLFVLKNGQITPVTNLNIDHKGYTINSEVYKDNRGNIHLINDYGHRIWNGSRFVKHPETSTVRFQTFGSSRKSLIVEDQQQNLWMSTMQGLVLRRHGQEHYEFLPSTHPLNREFINSICVDHENNLWLATDSGIYKVSEGKVRVYSIYDGIPTKRVTAVAALGPEHFLINTPGNQNFQWYENGQFRPYQLKDEPSRAIEVFHAFTDSKKRIWMATGGALILINPDLSNKTIDVVNNIRNIYEDKSGKIWFAISNKGIGYWADDSIKVLDFPGFSFKELNVSTIHQRGKGWLVTTFNEGLVLIDQNQRCTRLYDTLGFPPIGAFDALMETDGTFWLPTNLGLFYWNGQRFTKIQAKKGYLQYSLFDIVQDHRGNVWLPSYRGIVQVKKADLLRYVKSSQPFHANILDEGDGMLTRQCIGARHITVTPDRKILVPTYLGLVEVDPEKNSQNRVLPKVELDPMYVDGNAVKLNNRSSFPPGNHEYLIHFGALSTTASSKVRFRYRLDGYKNYWSELTAEDKVTYTNLPAGRYTFRVKAANNDGLWSAQEARASFVIRPFFYQTWWFWLLNFLLLLAGMRFYVRFRNRSILSRNENLENTVTKRTQELSQANQILQEQKVALEETLGHLKTTQVQLIQSEKLASLGELTAGIAHEIQNPLNFVNNFAELNRELIAEMTDEIDKGNLNEVKTIAIDLAANEEKIKHHGQRASSIVKGMLEHSRTSTGVKEPTDLNALADEFLRLAYHGLRAKDNNFNATIETHLDPNLPLVSVIPQDIGRVLLNLINNAFYAVQQRAVETLQATSLPYQPTVTITTQKSADQVIIKIQDNGNGIPESIRDKIFQPFFTTKPTGQGTGLGLSLAYDIVTKGHGGTLEVENTEEHETIFIVKIPL